MTEQPTRQSAPPDLPRRIALLVLAGFSGFVVWSFHTADRPAFLAALALGGLLGFLAGGLVGVHLPTLATTLIFGGPVGVVGGVRVVWPGR